MANTNGTTMQPVDLEAAPTHGGPTQYPVNAVDQTMGKPATMPREEHEVRQKEAVKRAVSSSSSMLLFAFLHLIQFAVGVAAFGLYWWHFTGSDSVNGPFNLMMRNNHCRSQFAPGEVSKDACDKYENTFIVFTCFVIASGLTVLTFLIGATRATAAMRFLAHIFALAALGLIIATVSLFSHYIHDVASNPQASDMMNGYKCVTAVCAWSIFLVFFSLIFSLFHAIYDCCRGAVGRGRA